MSPIVINATDNRAGFIKNNSTIHDERNNASDTPFQKMPMPNDKEYSYGRPSVILEEPSIGELFICSNIQL